MQPKLFQGFGNVSASTPAFDPYQSDVRQGNRRTQTESHRIRKSRHLRVADAILAFSTSANHFKSRL